MTLAADDAVGDGVVARMFGLSVPAFTTDVDEGGSVGFCDGAFVGGFVGE